MENENNIDIENFQIDEDEDYNYSQEDSYEEENYEYNNHILDVRIIVKDLKSAETLIKVINNMNLKENYNMNVSSIIPTTDMDIAKKATLDSDIILIATELTNESKEQFLEYYKELKTSYNYIEYLIFSKSNNLNSTDLSPIENEIHNSIIRASLTSILNNTDISKVQKQLYNLQLDYNKNQEINEQLSLENNRAIAQAKELSSKNEDLTDQIRSLQLSLDNIKSDYSNFKSQFANIYSKDLLEVFNIKELWEESFNEILNDESKVIIATNHFKPLNIVVGQGFIVAKTKDEAIDWLKIIRTTLIFLENDNGNLENEINNQNTNSNTYLNNNANFNNSSNDDYKKNNDKDYEVPNSFQNFWD